jgi:hypothetical protein
VNCEPASIEPTDFHRQLFTVLLIAQRERYDHHLSFGVHIAKTFEGGIVVDFNSVGQQMKGSTAVALAVCVGVLLAATVQAFVPASSASSPMTRALYVHSAGDPSAVTHIKTGLVNTGMIGFVDELDVQTYTPVATDFTGYDYVFVASNQDMQDNHVVGDVLAGVVDGGIRVVEMTFSFACSNNGTADVKWGLGGRWEDELYAPILPSVSDCDGYRYDAHFTLVAESGQSSSAYLAGVGNLAMDTTIQNNFTNMHTNLVVASGATPIAHWNDSDSTPLLAVGDNCVVGINVWPQDIQFRIDPAAGYRLMANAATTPCTSTRSTPTTTSSTSSSSTSSIPSSETTDVSTSSSTTLVASGVPSATTTTQTTSSAVTSASSDPVTSQASEQSRSRVAGPMPDTGSAVRRMRDISLFAILVGVSFVALRRRFV